MKGIIENIEIKLAKLITKFKQIKLENSNLHRDNDALNAKIKDQEKKIFDLQDKVKLMNITKSVDRNQEDVKSTRLKINEYVREIDKCIALLNK